MATPRYVIKKVGSEFVPQRQDATEYAACVGYTAAGAVLALHGLKRSGLLGMLIIGGGALLAYRGVTGKNPLANYLACAKARPVDAPSYPRDHKNRSTQRPADEIDEASMESFPASDPPAHHRTTASP